MSIAGVVAIGGAGVLLNNFIFEYHKDQYEVAIARLEELVNRLDGHLTKLRELRANVPNFWDDDDAKDTCFILDKTIERIVFDMGHCKDLIAVYKNAVAEFDNSKATVSNLLKDAIGILNGLGN